MHHAFIYRTRRFLSALAASLITFGFCLGTVNAQPCEDDIGCDIMDHFALVPAGARNCLAGFTCHQMVRENKEVDGPKQRTVGDLVVRAICRYPIACNHEGATSGFSYKVIRQEEISVSGSASAGVKFEVGNIIAALIGVEASFEVTAGGGISWLFRSEYTVHAEVRQSDCDDQKLEMKRTFTNAKVDQTWTETLTWILSPDFFHPDGTIGRCPRTPVVTRCTRDASGPGANVFGDELLNELTRCCTNPPPPKPPKPGEPLPPWEPCCGRVCPD